MRILFCDDDPLILNQLQAYVSEYFTSLGCSLPQFAAYRSGESLLESERSAELAFLDVEMTGINGIQVGKILKEANPGIKIFMVTSFPDYLDEAMGVQVFRYLSKPIDKARLFRNLKDALYQLHIETKKIPIETAEGIVTVAAENIICVEASGRKVTVHTKSGPVFSIRTMAYWRNALNLPCFFETHRSFIVNMHIVYRIEKDKVRLKWDTGSMDAYLTRRKYTAFKNAYLLFMESVK